MGNICPANKGPESGGHHTYKPGNSSREQVYKIQKGQHENTNSSMALGVPNQSSSSSAAVNGHHSYPPHVSNHNPINGNGNILLQQLHHQQSHQSQVKQQQQNSLNAQIFGGLMQQPIGSPLPHTSSILEKPNYIALFDYESATKDDMTIKKNDQLIVIDKSHPDWWLAKNLRTKETGYVPFNYITTIDDLQIKEYVYFFVYLS